MPKSAIKSKVDPVARLKARYTTYNPAVEGYGNPSQWKSSFEYAMGHDEAIRILGKLNPITVLGFKTMPEVDELKTRFRELIMQAHPDQGGSEEKAKEIIAAYSELKRKI